jgi:hypothetical protein
MISMAGNDVVAVIGFGGTAAQNEVRGFRDEASAKAGFDNIKSRVN